ncbi:MAG: fatty acid hydroxylase, partial [Pedobacter sp.]
MKKNFISNSSSSIRMFKSDFMESLSKVKYYVPLIVYIPVIGYLFYKSFAEINMSVISFAGWFLLGLAIWTITEYILH